MSRHAKNNTASACFTYEERQKLKYGTVKERLGRDSLKNWDQCCLCLQPIVEPLSCSKGHIFCKECIYESLLQQKNDIKRKESEYEAQEAKRKEKEEKDKESAKLKEIKDFERIDSGILPQASKSTLRTSSSSSSGANNDIDRKSLEALNGGSDRVTLPDGRVILLFHKYDNLADQQTQADIIAKLRKNYEEKRALPSFWLPSLTPSAEATEIAKPSTVTMCPEGNHPLRLKHLIPLKLSLVDDKTDEKGSSASSTGKSMYRCGVCMNNLTNSVRAVLVKGCGHVLCLTCAYFILTEKKCTLCNSKVSVSKDLKIDSSKKSASIPLNKQIEDVNKGGKDLILLQEGGTGFAANNSTKLESTKVTPTAWL